jgi:DNA-3-methyladenine glycosylase II
MAMQRFRVVEDSMRPALAPGDEFVVTDSRAPALGEVVVLTHPRRPDFWLVKRKVDPPSPLGDGLAWVLSDNSMATTTDSRSLGPVESTRLRPMVDRLDPITFAEGVDLLCAEDTALAGLVAEHGVPAFWRRAPEFATLLLFILEQQVSLESGAAVYRRVAESAGTVDPGSVLTVGPQGLAAAGVTRQKTGYILALAEKLVSGALDLEAIGRAPVEEARSALLEVTGVGPWTADVYLLSALGHIDVFPVGDRALQVGAGEALGMSTPDPGQLEMLAEPWRPLRAIAARLIWHGYLSRRGRAEPPPPSPVAPRRVQG